MANRISSDGLKVVAAIPAYNVQRFISDVVRRTMEHVSQVIVIDDGSRDGTAEAARVAGALVISHDTNKGYGEAIKSCFKAAKATGADVLVVLDGDGQHNPEEIPKLLAPVLRGKAELIIGSRFLTNKHKIPRYRKFGISVITFLWNFGSKVKVSDAQSGFRVYSKEIFEASSLSEKGMGISIEILEEARRKGTTIKEVPISCLYLPSTINLKAIRHGLGVALSVVRIGFKNRLLAMKGKDEPAQDISYHTSQK